MDTKVLNVMLYRQTLMLRSLSNKLKELDLQVKQQESFIGELKEAIGYHLTDFSKLEMPDEVVPDITTCSIEEKPKQGWFDRNKHTSFDEAPC